MKTQKQKAVQGVACLPQQYSANSPALRGVSLITTRRVNNNDTTLRVTLTFTY